MPKKKKRPGRPPGSRQKPRVEVVAVLGRCPRPGCQSTELAGCTQTIETVFAGKRDGKPYTHVVRRWKRCKRCGQAVIETSYENRRAAEAREGDAR
jgi:hypothetical protein